MCPVRPSALVSCRSHLPSFIAICVRFRVPPRYIISYHYMLIVSSYIQPLSISTLSSLSPSPTQKSDRTSPSSVETSPPPAHPKLLKASAPTQRASHTSTIQLPETNSSLRADAPQVRLKRPCWRARDPGPDILFLSNPKTGAEVEGAGTGCRAGTVDEVQGRIFSSFVLYSHYPHLHL
jgi:hypothetical protein